MNLRILTIALGLGTMLATAGLSIVPADAQEPTIRTKRIVRNNSTSPNYSYQQGPRTRIYVSRRSWLDLGTEVQPGERKYTDYAIPPGYTQTTIDHLTGRPWARQPSTSWRAARTASTPSRSRRSSKAAIDWRVEASDGPSAVRKASAGAVGWWT